MKSWLQAEDYRDAFSLLLQGYLVRIEWGSCLGCLAFSLLEYSGLAYSRAFSPNTNKQQQQAILVAAEDTLSWQESQSSHA